MGLVATQGVLPARIASLLGFDVARGLTTDEDERAALRCAVIRLDVKQGTGTLDAMVIDTTHAQSRGSRSEEHTSELQSLMRTSYAVFCLKKKNKLHKLVNKSQHTTRHVQGHRGLQPLNTSTTPLIRKTKHTIS